MAINFNNPVTSQDRAAVLTSIRDHVTALAKFLDGETVSNVPTGAKRYSAGNDRFEEWDGATWNEMPLFYAKKSGDTFTGGIIGTTASFSGAITQGGSQVWHAGNFDPATKLGVSATAVRSQAVVTADPGVGQGGMYATATELYFRDGSANRKIWHENNFDPATKQNAATAWNTGNFNPASYQPALGYTPVNKAGDSSIGALTMASCTSSGAVTCSEWFRTNGATGWYNNTYGGGIYMIDTTYVRVYGGVQFYSSNHIVSAGNMYAADFIISSDKKLKKAIKPIKDALWIVERLRGVTFKYRASGKQAFGVIAQEVDDVLPTAVQENEAEGHLAVSYSQITAVLVEAVKELSMELAALRAKVA